jgi:hypothetical protein
MNGQAGTLPTYLELLNQLIISLDTLYDDLLDNCPNFDELVAPALLSEKVKFSTSSPHKRASRAKARTYESYIAAGIYINDVAERVGTPILSPLILRIMLNDSREWVLAEPLRAMLELEAEPELNRPEDSYEKFHAHWEQLWRQLQGVVNKRLVSLSSSFTR